jgi:hypothetical protein
VDPVEAETCPGFHSDITGVQLNNLFNEQKADAGTFDLLAQVKDLK